SDCDQGGERADEALHPRNLGDHGPGRQWRRAPRRVERDTRTADRVERRSATGPARASRVSVSQRKEPTVKPMTAAGTMAAIWVAAASVAASCAQGTNGLGGSNAAGGAGTTISSGTPSTSSSGAGGTLTASSSGGSTTTGSGGGTTSGGGMGGTTTSL